MGEDRWLKYCTALPGDPWTHLQVRLSTNWSLVITNTKVFNTDSYTIAYKQLLMDFLKIKNK